MRYKKRLQKHAIKCLKINQEATPPYSINGMINVVEQYFTQLFSAQDIDEQVSQVFLDELTRVEGLDDLEIMRPISLTELREVILLLLRGKGTRTGWFII